MSTYEPSAVLAAITELRNEQRAGLADIRRDLARVRGEQAADVLALRADIAALAVVVNQVADALADHVREHPGATS